MKMPKLGSRLLNAIFAVSLAFVLGASVWVYSAMRDVPGPIIVDFNDAVGIDRVGQVYELLLAGFTVCVAIILNFFVAVELESRNRFLSGIMAAATLFLSLLIFIAFAAIISVN